MSVMAELLISIIEHYCREIISAVKGMKEDQDNWRTFFVWLRECSLEGVLLIIGDNLACWGPYPKSSRMPVISVVLFISTAASFLLRSGTG